MDTALDAYHGAAQAVKLAAMDALLQAITTYIGGRTDDPRNDRLSPARKLLAAAQQERPLVSRLVGLAAAGVVADINSVTTLTDMKDGEIAALAGLQQVTTVAQIERLHRLTRADAQIIAIAAIPRVVTFDNLLNFAGTTRTVAELTELADLGNAGMGGQVLPSQPSWDELRKLAWSTTPFATYALWMGTVVLNSASELLELSTTDSCLQVLKRLRKTTADSEMTQWTMDARYGGQAWGRPGYGSVYAIAEAVKYLGPTASSNQMLVLLQKADVLTPNATAVPRFIADDLAANWMQRHTGAEGVHYQGGDRGDDTKAPY